MSAIALPMLRTMEQDSIAKGLRTFRRALDLTQEQMASRLGLKRTTYTSYEQELARIPGNVLEDLARMGFRGDTGPPAIPAAELRVPIPFLGSIAASAKVDWTDPFESEAMEYVPSEMAGRGRYCCRVASDSCYDLLWPGDIAVFQRQDVPRIGAIVMYRDRDRRITIKQLKHDGTDYILHPLNAKYEDVKADGDMVGVLVGIVREQGSRRVTVYDDHGIAP